MKKTATLTSLSGSLGRSVKVILTLLFLNFFVTTVSGQTIKIDGLTTVPANEWCQAGITHIQDLFGSGVAEDQFTQGSKDYMYAVDWRWAISQTKGKNDLANLGAAILPAGSVLLADGSVASGGPFLVFAGDRLVNNGDAQIGFWFFQNGTAPVVTQPGNIQNFAPPKKVGPGAIVGDILVLADFTGGGRDAAVTVLEWVGTGGNYVESDAFNLLAVGAAVAENNAGPTPVPTCGWGYPTANYDVNAFFEGYIDLASIGAASVCFSRAMLEGRSSQSIEASLDDFVGGPLGSVPNCSIAGSNTICQGSSTCFTATGGTGTFTYSWSGPNSFTASTAVICNLTANGTYNVTVSNATGCTSGCSRTLTVNSAPTCNITGNNTICSYQTASFTASGGSSYSWSGPASFTAATAVISNLTAQGTYNVTVTSSAGCTSTCSRTLTVNNPPSCSIDGNNTICSGGSASFTATGGGTYAWSGPASFAATGAIISNLTAQGTYTVTVTSAQGCTSSCSRTLTVNNTPTCNITGNNTICSYQTASFTATGGNSYSWSGPASFTASSAIISNLTAQGTYNVTVTASGGCTSTCSRTLTVNPRPDCNITGNNTICVGNTASFTATGGGTYAWSGPASFTASSAVISNLTAAGTYTVTVTSGAGCTSTCNRTLTVNPNPTVDAGNPPAAQCRVASIVGGAFVFGTNTFTNVTGTMNNAQSPVWTVAPGGNPNGFTVGFSAPNSLTTNVNISGNVNGGTVTIRLTVQSNQTPSCGSAFDDVTLTINPLPEYRAITGSAFCPNVTTSGSVSLANSQIGVSYQLWTDGPLAVQAPKDGTGGTLTWSGLAAGNYYAVGTFLATTCNTQSNTDAVVENSVPEVSITPVEQLCTDANCVTLVGSPVGGTFSGTGVSNGQFCPGGLAPGGYTVTYSYTNQQSCTATTTITIDVVSCGEPLCTYTQGAYGNAGGMDCDGTTSMSTTALINQSIAHWGGTLTIGCGTNKVTISTGQASCVIERLPGGGPSKEISGVNTICQLPNERIKNTLLAQTITLGLNIGITSPSTLSDFPLQAGTLYTAGLVGGCGTDVAEPRICHYDPITHLLTSVENEYISRTFSQALIDAIVAAGYPATVGGLFSLANDALCNKDGTAGTERGVSLSEIAGAAGSINEVFDECRVPQGWNVAPCPPSDLPPVPRITVGSIGESPVVENLKVSVFPNPYRDNVRFVIQSPVAGQAVLDVYNIAGQKVQTLFSGHIDANETRVVDFKPGLANAMMIYKFRVGTQQVTGKLVGLKQ